MDRHRHRTVDRISQVLELVAGRHEGLTLSELARDVSAPVSSMQGLVNGLVATGFLDRSGSRYFLGPAPYVLTLQARQNMARLVTHGDLTNLAEDGGHTVMFAVRIGDDAVTIDEAGNQPLLQYLARTRQRVPLLTASVGKVILAALPDDNMHDYLRRSPRQDLVSEFVSESARSADRCVCQCLARRAPRGLPRRQDRCGRDRSPRPRRPRRRGGLHRARFRAFQKAPRADDPDSPPPRPALGNTAKRYRARAGITLECHRHSDQRVTTSGAACSRTRPSHHVLVLGLSRLSVPTRPAVRVLEEVPAQPADTLKAHGRLVGGDVRAGAPLHRVFFR